MMKALVWVVVIGAGIGAMMPAGNREATSAPAPESAEEAALVSPTAPLRELILDRRGDGHFYVDGLVNGREAHFLVDTGASHTALTLDSAKSLGLDVDPSEFDYVARGAGGPVRGQVVTLDRVVIGGRVVTNARAAVIEGLEVNLLGQSVLSQLGTLEISRDRLTLR
jgi:aspartyl protease family protein